MDWEVGVGRTAVRGLLLWWWVNRGNSLSVDRIKIGK